MDTLFGQVEIDDLYVVWIEMVKFHEHFNTETIDESNKISNSVIKI